MTDEKNDTFGDRLRKVREALGWTRAELAVQARVSDVTIKCIELGREGLGKLSALQVLSAIAKHDLKRARWIAEATDAPPQALAALELSEAVPVAPPPIGARILIIRRGTSKELSIRMDWEVAAQFSKYLAWQELMNPDSCGLAVAISVAGPDSPGSG